MSIYGLSQAWVSFRYSGLSISGIYIFCCRFLNFDMVYLQEKRREEEEGEARSNMQLAQLAAHAKIAKDLSNEVLKNLSSVKLAINSCFCFLEYWLLAF